MTSIAQNLIDAVSFGGLYALLALGVALIFGIMRLVNFAHGELIMVGGYAVVLLSGVTLGARIALVIAIVAAVALVIERTAIRPVRHADPATLLITSFAIGYLMQSLAVLILGSLPRTTNLSDGLSENFEVAGVTIQKLDVVTIVTMAALLLALAGFLGRTRMGLQMRAAAEDFRMARILGVRSNAVIALAFAISGALAAIASILIIARSGVADPQMGSAPILVALIATVLGGLGSLRGAVLGGFVLGFLTVALQAYLPLDLRSYRDAFAYGAVFLVLLLRPQGLFVRAGTGERL
jgi:branched-chain amino acid transport system permease protein